MVRRPRLQSSDERKVTWEANKVLPGSWPTPHQPLLRENINIATAIPDDDPILESPTSM